MKTSSILVLSILLVVGTDRCQAYQEIEQSTSITEFKKRDGRIDREKKKVVAVYLGGKEFEDADFKYLTNLPELTSLQLWGTKLRTLDLFETRVGDKGLEQLKGLTGLTQLLLPSAVM